MRVDADGGSWRNGRERHKVLLEVCMALAERIVVARLAKEAAGRQQAEQQPQEQRAGQNQPKSKKERMRWKVAKWERMMDTVGRWSGTISARYLEKWGGEGVLEAGGAYEG